MYILLECGFETKIIEITVKDRGTFDFDVKNVLENSKKLMQDDTESKINAIINQGGGLGLIVVQKYVDEIEITTHPDGTVVKLVKLGHSE
jgi:anti-sigma regulatory factor (Ser/Thr protein kinase)